MPFAAGSKGALISQSGDVAVTTVTVPDNEDKISDWGKDLRDITGTDANGMSIYVTGDLGFNADFEEVFSGIDTTLLLATVLLVLVLLGAIYRSPMIALIPLIVVGFAYTCAQGLIYLYAKTGQTVSRQHDLDPGRAHVRRRHRLLPLARLQIPGGAAPPSRTSTRRWRSRSPAPAPRSSPAA